MGKRIGKRAEQIKQKVSSLGWDGRPKIGGAKANEQKRRKREREKAEEEEQNREEKGRKRKGVGNGD